MFYEQFKKICNANNTTPTAYVKERLKLSTSKVTAWKNGSLPKYEIIKQIAEDFNVSADYLLFGKEKATEDDQELLELLKNLSPKDKQQAIGMIKVLMFKDDPTEKKE